MAVFSGNGILCSHLAFIYVFVLFTACSDVERELALSAFPSSSSRHCCSFCYKALTTKDAVLSGRIETPRRVAAKLPAASDLYVKYSQSCVMSDAPNAEHEGGMIGGLGASSSLEGHCVGQELGYGVGGTR